MKKQINLIPNEMAVPAKTIKFAGYLNRISTIGTIIFISVVVILIVSVTYFNYRYNRVVSEVESLKTKILSLETSEQKLVLTKDRLSKIDSLKKVDSIDKEITSFENFYNIVMNASGSAFSDILMTPTETDATITFQSSAYMNSAIAAIYTLTDYKGITLTSLGYNPGSGYYVTLVFKD